MKIVVKSKTHFMEFDSPHVGAWLAAIGRQAGHNFRSGMLGPHSGIHHRGLPNRSSAVGEYPANQSGRMLASMRVWSNQYQMHMSLSVPYAKYLYGKRKLIKEAVQEAVATVGPIGDFIRE